MNSPAPALSWTSITDAGTMARATDTVALDKATHEKHSLLERHHDGQLSLLPSAIAQSAAARVLDSAGVPVTVENDALNGILNATAAFYADIAANIALAALRTGLVKLDAHNPVQSQFALHAQKPPERKALTPLHDFIGFRAARDIRIALYRQIEQVLPDEIKPAGRRQMMDVLKLDQNTLRRHAAAAEKNNAKGEPDLYKDMQWSMLFGTGVSLIALSAAEQNQTPVPQETFIAAREPYLASAVLRRHADTDQHLWRSEEGLLAYTRVHALSVALLRHANGLNNGRMDAQTAEMSQGVVHAAKAALGEALRAYKAFEPCVTAGQLAQSISDTFSSVLVSIFDTHMQGDSPAKRLKAALR